MNSAKVRKDLCNLPPRLAFPLSTQGASSQEEGGSSDVANDEARSGRDFEMEGERRTSHQQLWSNQIQEDLLMETAHRQVEWVINRLIDMVKSNGYNSDGGEGGTCTFKDEDADATIRQIFGKIQEVATNKKSSSSAAEKWTMFDLQQIATKCEELIDKDIHHLLLVSLEKEEFITTGSGCCNDHDKEMCQSWSHMLKEDSSLTKIDSTSRTCPWEDLFLLPYRIATSEILLSTHSPNNKTVNNTIALDNQAIENYLKYHAAQILDHMEHVTLPSLQKQLLQQEKCRAQRQTQHKIIDRMNNDAFEQWDDYCMNILGVDSDSLPLFPDIINNGNANNGNLDTTAVDGYAREVGKCVVKPMRLEFEELAERFLQSLASKVNDEQGDSLRNVCGVKCYGSDILKAIIYYRHFTSFLVVASGGSANNQKGEDLSTLHYFVTSAQKQGDEKGEQSSSTQVSLTLQFTTSPKTRANLVGDLHQLEAFLSSRKRELSPRTLSSRSGRDIVDDISLQWTQYCLQEASSSCLPSTLTLDEISLDDVINYLNAVHNVSMQIVGEGAQAKRLRFLADAVGLPTNSNVGDCLTFQSICRNGAFLAYKMTLCQDQQEASALMSEGCTMAIGSTTGVIANKECRAKMIRGRLDGITCVVTP